MGKKKKLLSTIYNSSDECLDYVSAMGGFDETHADFYELAICHEIHEPEVLQESAGLAKPKERTSTRKPSPFELTRRLLKEFHLRNFTGALYAYDPPLYAPAKFNRIAEMLRQILTDEELSRLSMQDFKGAYEYLFTESKIKVAELPIYPGCVLFENGRFNILTGERLDNSPDTICLTQVGARYEWGYPSDTPVFDEFLQACSDGDAEIQRLILAFLGYCLIPDQGGKCFFILGTSPNSGKSVLAAFLQRLVGNDVVSSVSLNDLHNSFALAPLVGKVLNLSMDLNSDYLNGRAVSAIKMLTGGDTVTINEKYQPMFSYRNVAKFIFATNSPVLLKKPDEAFWERMVIVPFTRSVDKEEQDKELLDKLWEERNGIVSKAMKAARKLIRNNYIFPQCHVAETMKSSWAKNEALSIVSFVQECCDIHDQAARSHTHRLYTAYIGYCVDNGLEIESENLFSRVLGNQFALKRSRWSQDGCTAQRGFLGIQLFSSANQ